MRRSFVSALATALIAVPAFAALPDGTKAPDFSTEASLAGKTFHFSLAKALQKGPVVLYFYPAAFTPGCTTIRSTSSTSFRSASAVTSLPSRRTPMAAL
jgi:hypothetical protein